MSLITSVNNMNRCCVDSAIKELSRLEKDSRLTSSMNDQIQILQLELRFLKLYLWFWTKWNVALFRQNTHFGFVRQSHIKSTLGKATKGLYRSGVRAMNMEDFEDWDTLASNLQQKILQCKPRIEIRCLASIDCSIQSKFSNNELDKFMLYIYISLDELMRLKADMVVDLKLQIEALKEKLGLFINLFYDTTNQCSSSPELKDFKNHLRAWACSAACLSLLYWVLLDEKEQKLDIIVSELLQKTKPSIPKVRGLYAALKASFARRDESIVGYGLRMGETVALFVDYILHNLEFVQKKVGTQIVRDGLIFLITFLLDPPETKKQEKDGKSILTKVDAVINECISLISIFSASEWKDGVAEEWNMLLDDFFEKIEAAKAEVKELHAHIFLDYSSFNFPRTYAIGFIDFLLEELKEISIHLAKHQVVILAKELLSIRPFIEDIFVLQNDHKEIKDLWARIIDVAYQANDAVNSICTQNSVYYHMVSLSTCIEEILLVKNELKKIQDQQIYNIKTLDVKTSSNPILPIQANISRMDELVVGFEDEAKAIIDRLTRGSRELEITSIVGMPGVGKTTLAKKVYGDPLVKYYFNKCAWCFVSQTYKRKKLLLAILTDITALNDDLSRMTEEELAERLYKCLKGQRYLIVMDDIWDSEAWDALKESLPNDSSGSRIMFTSRIHSVGLQAKFHCSVHPLHPLTIEESWELLQKKLFHKDYCPPEFSEVGKKIAKDCKGLPLAIVVIAGVLSGNAENLDWWKEIAGSVSSRIASEGCMDILELSYKHLPEYLKPCFLYFGVFQEDKVIRVRKLVQLWISEGFIRISEAKSLEDVAKDYLMDLVARSLVTVANISSNDWIKACQLHDLLREFCLAKGEEENFLHVTSGNDVSPYSSGAIYKHYRLCIQTKWRRFLDSCPSGPCLHTLIFSFNDTLNLYHYDHFSFTSFKVLQVLDLEDIEFLRPFPKEILALVLLRYLAIWCASTFIPPSIVNLENLVTFRVKLCEHTIQLPYTIWKMKSLRHVELGRSVVSFIGCCEPEESARLDNIQTFSSPSLSYGEDAEKLLRRLPAVRKLKCQFHESWDPNTEHNQMPVLDALTQLESLNVLYIGRMLYSCTFNFPSTLKKLTLTDFNLPWCEISTIAKLPNLVVLKLLKDAFIGERWDMGDAEFLNLKFLKLCELNIAQWKASDDTFPCLQRLVVEQCYKLEKIPSRIGDIPTLKTIQVRWCKSTALNSAKQIQEEQVDLGNEDLEVLITEIEKMDI